VGGLAREFTIHIDALFIRLAVQ